MGKTTPKTTKTAKTNKKAKPAKPTIETRPEKTDAQIQNSILVAQRTNPPGVRVANPNIEANWRIIAHYTGFADTSSIKDWMYESKAAETVLEPFIASFKAHFGSTKAIQVRRQRLFEVAYGEEAPAMFHLSIPLPQDPNNPDPNERELSDRALWTWVVTMHKLIVCSPSHFFAEPGVKGERTCQGLPDERREPLENGHSPEDWSRAYSLIKARIRMSSRPTAGESSTRQRNEQTVEPLCLTIEQEAVRHLKQNVLPLTQTPGASAAPLPSGNDNDTVDQTVAAEIRQDNLDAIHNEQRAQELRESYMTLQTTLNTVSTTPPTFAEACSTLNMDPSRPILELITDALPADRSATAVRALKPWQVQFLVWARLMEQSKLCAWLLADEMGLGKTISALSRLICAYAEAEAKHKLPVEGSQPLTSRNDNGSIAPHNSENDTTPSINPRVEHPLSVPQQVQSGPEGQERTKMQRKVERIAQLAAIVEKLRVRRYKPTLILAPSQATNDWKHEIRCFFPDIQARYFFQNPSRLSASRERTLTLGETMEDLLRYLTRVPDTPEALRYVVISSYSTWTKRSLYKSDPSTDAQAESLRNSTTKHEVEDPSGGDHDNDDERVIQREDAKKWTSHCPDVFGRVICDDSERLKNPNTHSHISVARLRAPILNFLTATPMTKKDDIPEEREFRIFSELGFNDFMKPLPRAQGIHRALVIPGLQGASLTDRRSHRIGPKPQSDSNYSFRVGNEICH